MYRRTMRPSSPFPAAGALLLSLLGLAALLLQRVGAGWVDPDTPANAQTARSYKEGGVFRLVMSDEFDVVNRTFADGEDPTWTASDHSDDARTSTGKGALIFYNHSYVSTTEDGKLNITTTSQQTRWRGFNPYTKKHEWFTKDFRGGMVNSWNKFCFSGGIIEASIKLPGDSDTGGLWPAFWLMGNLGRATYEFSTNMMWPWSYNVCDRQLQPAQELSACAKTRHWDLHSGQGRGATEIDIMEVMPGKAAVKEGDLGVGLPYMSTTLQISPGIRSNRPVAGKDPKGKGWNWYEGLFFGAKTRMNMYFYGTLLDKTQKDEPAGRSIHQAYQADALSALTPLTSDNWDSYHTYRLEWMPGKEGYLAWYLDGELLYEVPALALNVTGAQVPTEPSYIIFNTAVSTSWGFPQACPDGCACDCYDCSKPECRCGLPPGFCDMLPASMFVDWVRVYQLENDPRHFVGCDHPTHPTRKFIQAHRWRYQRDTENIPLQAIQRGYGACKKAEDCAPGGTCNTRKRACLCKEGWTGPHCKQRTYGDDDARGPIRLPVYALRPPTSLGVILTVLAGALIAAVMMVVSQRERQERAGEGGYQRMASG